MKREEILAKVAAGELPVEEAARLLAQIKSDEPPAEVPSPARLPDQQPKATGRGDTDPKAYLIALIGGVIGGVLGSHAAMALGACLPVFIYQMGLDAPLDELTVVRPEDSQGVKGAKKFGTALIASMVPAVVGLLVGGIVLTLVHGINTFPQ